MLVQTRPEILHTQIPNIIQIANNLPPEGQVFELYTDETRTEFHHLLLELLDRFEKALDALTAMDENNLKVANVSDQVVKQFKRNVTILHRNGYALLKLS